ncbi:hypothetical protein AKO1_013743 [Acrasis kona]|uniref:BTB domain-containing protein n=1 Tax=Acrasis kona TaxID=1008807 RepID=A0AAW2ZIT9_9EUKA
MELDDFDDSLYRDNIIDFALSENRFTSMIQLIAQSICKIQLISDHKQINISDINLESYKNEQLHLNGITLEDKNFTCDLKTGLVYRVIDSKIQSDVHNVEQQDDIIFVSSSTAANHLYILKRMNMAMKKIIDTQHPRSLDYWIKIIPRHILNNMMKHDEEFLKEIQRSADDLIDDGCRSFLEDDTICYDPDDDFCFPEHSKQLLERQQVLYKDQYLLEEKDDEEPSKPVECIRSMDFVNHWLTIKQDQSTVPLSLVEKEDIMDDLDPCDDSSIVCDILRVMRRSGVMEQSNQSIVHSLHQLRVFLDDVIKQSDLLRTGDEITENDVKQVLKARKQVLYGLPRASTTLEGEEEMNADLIIQDGDDEDSDGAQESMIDRPMEEDEEMDSDTDYKLPDESDDDFSYGSDYSTSEGSDEQEVFDIDSSLLYISDSIPEDLGTDLKCIPALDGFVIAYVPILKKLTIQLDHSSVDFDCDEVVQEIIDDYNDCNEKLQPLKIKDLSEVRLDESDTTDSVIKAYGHYWRVHKRLLCAKSGFFNAMNSFHGNDDEEFDADSLFDQSLLPCFELCLYYIYDGVLDDEHLDVHQVMSVLFLAKLLLIDDLIKDCYGSIAECLIQDETDTGIEVLFDPVFDLDCNLPVAENIVSLNRGLIDGMPDMYRLYFECVMRETKIDNVADKIAYVMDEIRLERLEGAFLKRLNHLKESYVLYAADHFFEIDILNQSVKDLLLKKLEEYRGGQRVIM